MWNFLPIVLDCESDFKTLSDGLVKISKGKLFHNLVAETDKALLP